MCIFLENFKGRTAAAISPKELLDLLRSNDVVSSVDTGGKVFTKQELDKLLDRTDMVTSPPGSDVTTKDDVTNEDAVNDENNNNNEVTLCDDKGKNNKNKNTSMESEENADEKNSNNGKEEALFKVIGVSNSEEITF